MRPDGTPILLLGNYRPALTIARSLGRCGYRIIMGTGGGEGCSEYSRFVSEKWDHPPVETAEFQFLDALDDLFRRRPDVRLVFPVTEAFVLCLARWPDRLPDDVTVVSPNPAVIDRCLKKLSMLALADDAAVPVLPYAVADQDGDFDGIAERIGFPLVVRPLPPRFRFEHEKAIILDDDPAYRRFLARWLKPGERFLFQRFAPGDRHNVFFAARDGGLLQTLETRILRTDNIAGTGLAVDALTCRETDALTGDCERLVGALGYTGIGLAQFHVDPRTGERCFLELNPRIAGSQAIAEQVGFETSRMAVDLALGKPVAAMQPRAIEKSGVRYVWTYGDLRGLRSALSRGEIGPREALRWAARLVWSASRADYHMTWALDDPMPTLMLFAEQLLPAIKHRRRRARQFFEEAKS